MRVTVCTAWTPSYDALASVTAPALVAYCDRHGYRADVGRHEAPEPAWWLKVERVAALLPGTDLLLWLDADARIMEPAVRVEDLTGLDLTADLWFTCDWHGLNAGVLLWRRSAWSLTFVSRWLAMRKHVEVDQHALAHMLYREPAHRWHVLPQRAMNSYLHALVSGGRAHPYPEGEYRPGDFVLHLPDTPHAQRVEAFRKLGAR